MTEAGIDSNFSRDLFVALGESMGQGAWAVRIYYKPLVIWIWLGALIMALGAVCSISDPRYRIKVRQTLAPVTPSVLSKETM